MQTITPLHRAIEGDGERAVHREIERRPWLLRDLVRRGGTCVISHFSLGDEYEADFVVLSGWSGGWDIDFIELEPPSLSPFNKKGDFSARMNHAAGQIRHWKEFEDRRDKRPYLVTQLRDAVIAKELLRHNGEEPTDSVGWPITHPESALIFHYHVVMGRRHHLNHSLMSSKAGLKKTVGFELMTYDRILEIFERQRRDQSYSDIYPNEMIDDPAPHSP